VGYSNKKGQFCLSVDDIQSVYKQFDLLYINRIQFQTTNQMNKKNKEAEQPSFKPALSKESYAIAQKYR
jgi:hypothetical protein